MKGLLIFDRMIGRDRAMLPNGKTLVHIEWMGVVCVKDSYGIVTWYMHGPS